MCKTVLITTSGTGERLGNITQYTNKSLINVGDKYAICRIIENYESDTTFVITIGYYGNLVREFLEMVYTSHKFIFVEVDKYVGDGSSLGYSMLKAMKYLQTPFIFHCCDAIVVNKIEFTGDTNILCVAKHICNMNYSSILGLNGKATEINNKKHPNFDYIYTGISAIHDYNIFWKKLEDIYNTDKTNASLSDVHVIQRMMNDMCEFKYIVLDDWYDTGNIDSYNIVSSIFKSEYDVLYKNNESLCFFDDIVVKFINASGVNQKRVQRGRQLYPLTPKIYKHTQNFIMMEKVQGTIMSSCYEHGEIYRLLKWAQIHLWVNHETNTKYKINCYNFYINKTLKRINDISFLKIEKEMNTINSLETGSIQSLINQVSDMNVLITDTFCNFHGDFILDNIIKTQDSYTLIDWRHEFDDQLIRGDLYYDLAKLRHNIIFNHKNVLQDMYTVLYDENNVNIDIKCNYFLVQQLYDYDKFVKEHNMDLVKIKILMGLIWINMSPLYDGKLSEFLFYFGKYHLYISLNEYLNNS